MCIIVPYFDNILCEYIMFDGMCLRYVSPHTRYNFQYTCWYNFVFKSDIYHNLELLKIKRLRFVYGEINIYIIFLYQPEYWRNKLYNFRGILYFFVYLKYDKYLHYHQATLCWIFILSTAFKKISFELGTFNIQIKT